MESLHSQISFLPSQCDTEPSVFEILIDSAFAVVHIPIHVISIGNYMLLSVIWV